MLGKVFFFFCTASAALAIPFPDVKGAAKTEVDVCSLPPVTSLIACEAFIPRWTYNSEKKSCEKFIYGGCFGTENLFKTKVACLARCNKKADRPEKCHQPKKSGLCYMKNTVYFFDSKKEKCVAFNYCGSDGNENRFATIEECRQTCNEKPESSVCDLPVEAGLCEAYIPSYYYNKASGTCDSFIYGGCSGNGNRFNNVDECQQTCVKNTLPRSVVARATTIDPVKDTFARCKLPSETGPCKGGFRRFFYDSDDKQCKVFTYGGCMGNANNFKTKQECLSACNQDDDESKKGISDDSQVSAASGEEADDNDVRKY